MSAAPERIYAIILPNEPPLVFREGSQPANAIPYVRSDLAPKPVAGDDLVGRLRNLCIAHQHRKDDVEIPVNTLYAVYAALSERRGEWQWMPYDEAKAFLTWLDAQPTKPSEKLQEAYDFYLKNYKGDRPL